MSTTLEAAPDAETAKPAKSLRSSAKAEATPKQKRLILLVGDKGGVGRSFIARTIAEQLFERKTGTLLVDGDGTTASLYKHFAGGVGSNPVRTFALHGAERDRDEIASLLESEAPAMLLDLPATSLTVLRRVQAEIGWTALIGEHGWRPTVVASITPFEESIFDLRDAMEFFGTGADYVAVVNLGMAEERSDFSLWDCGQTRERFVAAGGVELEFPRLKPRIAAALAKAGLTFGQGVTSDGLSLADRSRLARWLAQASASLAPAAERLGL